MKSNLPVIVSENASKNDMQQYSLQVLPQAHMNKQPLLLDCTIKTLENNSYKNYKKAQVLIEEHKLFNNYCSLK